MTKPALEFQGSTLATTRNLEDALSRAARACVHLTGEHDMETRCALQEAERHAARLGPVVIMRALESDTAFRRAVRGSLQPLRAEGYLRTHPFLEDLHREAERAFDQIAALGDRLTARWRGGPSPG